MARSRRAVLTRSTRIAVIEQTRRAHTGLGNSTPPQRAQISEELAVCGQHRSKSLAAESGRVRANPYEMRKCGTLLGISAPRNTRRSLKSHASRTDPRCLCKNLKSLRKLALVLFRLEHGTERQCCRYYTPFPRPANHERKCHCLTSLLLPSRMLSTGRRHRNAALPPMP